MPGLPLFTDNHVRGPLIKALRQGGLDVARAVDLFFLTCDEGIQAIAHDWLRQGRTDFRIIYCTMEHQQETTIGGLLEAIEDILRKPDAFGRAVPDLTNERPSVLRDAEDSHQELALGGDKRDLG